VRADGSRGTARGSVGVASTPPNVAGKRRTLPNNNNDERRGDDNDDDDVDHNDNAMFLLTVDKY